MPEASTKALISRKLYTLGSDVYLPYTVDIGFRGPFRHKEGWYELYQEADGTWWLHLAKGFQWNGANFYPDWDFIKIPSARHDVNHWLIERGVISPWENAAIDKQLEDDINNSKTPIGIFEGGLIPKVIRSWLIRRATNLCNSARKEGLIEHQSMFKEIQL